MSQNMEHFIPQLTRKEVKCGHWALWERAEEVNRIIGEWLDGSEPKDSERSML